MERGYLFIARRSCRIAWAFPLPASTQWEIVEAQAKRAEPVFEELLRQAAQGDVLHNDDTGVKILEMMGERARQAALAEERTDDAGDSPEDGEEGSAAQNGQACSPRASSRPGKGTRLPCSSAGRQHAGENLKDVLTRRAAELPPPIQMCDALARNLPGELKTIVANCLAHGRRQFVEVAERFPAECRHVLESLSVIYRNDAIAREQSLSPEERLLFHQTDSGPTMEELHVWLVQQFDQRLRGAQFGAGWGDLVPAQALGEADALPARAWSPFG